MWFFVALIAFINTALMTLLLGQELQDKGFGSEPGDRFTNCWLMLGFGCTLVTTVSVMLTSL